VRNKTRVVVVGTVVLAAALAGRADAQPDIVGFWGQPGIATPTGVGANRDLGAFIEDTRERAEGPTLVDYLGLPLNEEARARALSYDSSLLVVPEHQCMPHPAMYSFWGPATLAIETELDDNLNVVAYHVGGTFRRADRVIYMDRRPHPPEEAPHTWAGFTTGEWRGNTLVTRTTHLKWGWIRRNGVPASDQTTVTTFYTRNSDVLTVTVMVHDPIYLTETLVRSSDFVLLPRIQTANVNVPAASQGNGPFFKCYAGEEVAREEEHFVPHYFPWANPFVKDHAAKLGIPEAATLGGAETAYPEYRDRLRR
jgi:hypothetical protein